MARYGGTDQTPDPDYRRTDHPVWNQVERFIEPFGDTDREVLPQNAWQFIAYFARQARGPFIALLVIGGLVGGVDAALYWGVGWLIDILDSSTPATLLADHGREFLRSVWTGFSGKRSGGSRGRRASMAPNTGHLRDYSEGAAYADYFASPDLMFPTNVGDESLVARKDQVFGVRDVGIQKAWPIAAFGAEPVINDAIGDRALVLVGDADVGAVRAYERGERSFEPGDAPDALTHDGEPWRITETALVGPDGTRLDRVAGHIAYWFAWDSYFGVTSELYRP